MKAKKLLELYAKGERNFEGVNLRGQSFQGKNLSGANFSGADIRSADFSNAVLVGAKFVRAKAGLGYNSSLLVVSILLFFISASSIITTYAGLWAAYIVTHESVTKNTTIFPGICVFLFALIFCLMLGKNGFNWGSFLYSLFFLGAIGTFGGIVMYLGVENSIWTVLGMLGFALNFLYGILTLTITMVVSLTIKNFLLVLLFIFSYLLIALAFVTWQGDYGSISGTMLIAFLQAFFVIPLSLFVITENKKYALLKKFCVFCSTIKGTNFYNANLTDANFSSAILQNTDLRQANITRTNWRNIIKLDYSRFGGSYLDNPRIRQLVRTGQGEGINYNRFDIQGVNLQNANLKNANFIGANLNKANLQNADLTDAKLVHTQLDGANLTGATLTGAYIEDWAITSITKLDEIICDYVFMRLPPKERPVFIALPPEEDNDKNPRRKPDNWNENFEDDGFSFIKFISPMQQTLELYHSKKINWRAMSIAFNKLINNNPDAELSMAAIEFKGEDNDGILLKAKTSRRANNSKLSAEYYENYNNLRNLPSESLVFLIARQDKQMELLLESVKNTRNIYAKNYQDQGGTMTKNQNSTTYHQSGPMGIGHMSGGEIKDNAKVAGIINEPEQQNLADAVAQVQQILQQLSQTYPAETMSDRIAIANEAVKQIEANPTIKQRLLNAATEGGLAVIEKAFDNPIGALFVGVIKGWKEAE